MEKRELTIHSAKKAFEFVINLLDTHGEDLAPFLPYALLEAIYDGEYFEIINGPLRYFYDEYNFAFHDVDTSTGNIMTAVCSLQFESPHEKRVLKFDDLCQSLLDTFNTLVPHRQRLASVKKMNEKLEEELAISRDKCMLIHDFFLAMMSVRKIDVISDNTCKSIWHFFGHEEHQLQVEHTWSSYSGYVYEGCAIVKPHTITKTIYKKIEE